MIQSFPNLVPTSGEMRIARARLAETLETSVGRMREAALAGVGTADLVVRTLGTVLDRGLAAAGRITGLHGLARRAG